MCAPGVRPWAADYRSKAQMRDWLDRYRQLWDTRFEALDQLLVDMQAQQHEMQKEKKKERRHERTKRH